MVKVYSSNFICSVLWLFYSFGFLVLVNQIKILLFLISNRFSMYPKLSSTLAKIVLDKISKKRKEVLKILIHYVKEKLAVNQEPLLNFICTHNSRRSQLSQIWAQTAAYYYNINVRCFSGGLEVTAFNKAAVASLKRSGFKVEGIGKINSKYNVYYAQESKPIIAFSKLYSDKVNPSESFASIITCDHADENCPFIPYSEKRILLRYNDPKIYDNTVLEEKKYDERSFQIASEMLYVFKKVKD